MITERARRALHGLDERLRGHLDDWGNNAPPRRPRLGHTPSCPNNGRPMPRNGRCRFCRAEQLGRPDQPGPTRPAAPEAAPAALTELRGCTTCHRPTDHPTVLCDRCRPGEDT